MSTPKDLPDPIRAAATAAMERLPECVAIRVNYDIQLEGFTGCYEVGYKNYTPLKTAIVGAGTWEAFEIKMVELAEGLETETGT